jgi:hypothetical protein
MKTRMPEVSDAFGDNFRYRSRSSVALPCKPRL